MVLTLLRCNSDWKPDCHDFYRLQSTYEAAHVFLWVTSPSQTFVTPPLWPPSWSLTCWQQRRPFPTMVAWHSSSSCTSLGLIPSPKKRRSSSSRGWPMIARWPSASLCAAVWSWPDRSVLPWLLLPALGVPVFLRSVSGQFLTFYRTVAPRK